MLVAERYQILEVPRQGGARRARDVQTAQTVWLYTVDLPAEADAAQHALLRAHSAKGIFHPSLVTLFNVLPVEDHRVLLAYEFVAAQPLLEVAAGQPLPLRRAATIVAEVADAVAELHAHDVAHGAISQQTVLVTMKSKVKLDRTADPSLRVTAPGADDDLVALGNLLEQLVGRSPARGVVGAQAIETIIARTRTGRFESPATLAAMLRRL
ncbi:MAG: protein kinase [Acidobacteriota bacterium]